MKISAFIFARGGSKGVPGKNIKEMVGKPLLAYSIDVAKKIEIVDKIYVSTEDSSIASVAREYGASVIPRPQNLAQDNTPEWMAWRHALQWIEKKGDYCDIFLSLPTTSPLRIKEDVIECLNSLDNKTDIVVGITKSTHSPWFNIVHKNNNGYIEIVMKNKNHYTRRQETPSTYNITTVAYVCKPEFIKKSTGIFNGRVKGVNIPPERALDIDTELDFQVAEFLMSKTLNLKKAKKND